MRVLPVRVQGVEAPGEIAAAIDFANQHHLADLLIVGRGGGSIEDLWAFNDELVAHAIYRSEIPVISAVGHEPDVTISDFVADLRAATPSNAAELAVPDQDVLIQHLDSIRQGLEATVLRQLKTMKQQYRTLSASSALRDPYRYIKIRSDALKLIKTRMQATQTNNITRKKQKYIMQTAKLDALSPLKVLTRGYSMVQNSDGNIIRSVRQVSQKERIDITFCDGAINAVISEIKENT